jgi:4-hydroxyphenylacetate 3-monooxygenase
MGRLTDFMSGMLMDQVEGLKALGREDAAARAQWIVDYCRDNDLQVTHALVDPQSDRSKREAPSQAVQLVEQSEAGIVVSGCRMLSTLAPVANVCYVGPYMPRKQGEDKFALAFLIPMNVKGLSILGRESFHRGESSFDRPLTSRFDEGDAILMFDNVAFRRNALSSPVTWRHITECVVRGPATPRSRPGRVPQ